MRAIAERVAFAGGMFCKGINVIHLKGKMREIGADLHRAAGIVFANFDFLLTARCLEEDQVRSAPGEMPPCLL